MVNHFPNIVKKYRKPIQWLIVLACVIYIVHFFIQNNTDLKLFMQLKIWQLLAMTILFLLSIVIYALGFYVILIKCSKKSIPFFQWFKAVVLGRFLSLFAPQSGNIYRAYLLKQTFQISYTQYTSSFFFYFWIDTMLNLILCIVIVLTVDRDIQTGSMLLVHILLSALGILFFTPICFEVIFRMIRVRGTFFTWLHGKLSQLLTFSVQSLRDIRYLIKLVLIGTINFVTNIAILYLCFNSLQMIIPLQALVLFYILMKTSNYVVLTPGNIGIREIAYGLLGKYLQLGTGQGIIVSILIRLFGTVIVIGLGVLFGGIILLKQHNNTLISRSNY